MQFTLGGIHVFAIVRPELSYGQISDIRDSDPVGQSNIKRTPNDVKATHLERDEKRIFTCEKYVN